MAPGSEQTSLHSEIDLVRCSLVNLIILLILLPTDLYAQRSPYPYTIYNTDDGMPHNVIRHIGKDSRGFIWTSHGDNSICRFDGKQFTNYLPGPGKGAGFGCLGDYITEENGNFYLSNLWGILKYDPQQDDFINHLQRIIEEHPTIIHPKGYRHIIHETIWIFERGKIRSVAPDSDSGYIETILKIDDNKGQGQSIVEFPDGELWVGCLSGLYHLSSNNQDIDFTQIHVEVEGLPDPSQNIWHMYVARNQLWLLTREGLIKADIPSPPGTGGKPVIHGVLVKLDLPEIDQFNPGAKLLSNNLAFDGADHLFFRTWDGIFRYNIESGELEHIFMESYDRSYIFHDVLLYDDRGLLWAGTSEGLLKINLGNKNIRVIGPDPTNSRGLNFANLWQVLIDSKDRLWVGTEGDGLYKSVPDETGEYSEFEHYLPDPQDPLSIENQNVGMIFEDSRGTFYVGSSLHDTEVQQMDLSGREARFHHIFGPGTANQIIEGPDGKIFINQGYGISYIYDPVSGKTHPLYLDKEKTPYIKLTQYVATDQKIYLTVCKDLTLHALFEISGPLILTGDDPEPYYYPGQIRMIFDSTVVRNAYSGFFMTEHPGYKELWIPDQVPRTLRRFSWPDSPPESLPELVQTYDAKNDLSAYQPNGIIEDQQGRIWLSTDNGLTCLDVENNLSYRFYKEDGLPANKFSWGGQVDRKGNLFLCSENGLVYFHPDSLIKNEPSPVYITGLQLFYEPMEIGENAPLKKAALFTDRITLSHHQNFLSIEYAALDFINPKQIRYRYKMEGLDDRWVIPGDRRSADYPNLRRGNYTFRVIAANSNGVWNTEGDSIQIHIKPPPWFSWWAFVIYGLLVLWIIIWYRRYLINQAQLKTELQVERVEKEKVQEIDQMRSRFFANISHEFRTPLTLILGPVEDLLKNKAKMIENPGEQLYIIRRNTKRLQQMINQLLDLSRLETGKIKLGISEGNLTEFTRSIVLSFLSLAESRDIDYTNDLKETGDPVFFDADKVEKIITNLLSNAFKFTRENGNINIRLEYIAIESDQGPSHVTIAVQDSGRGIPADQLKKIFDRFYQVSSTDIREYEGTGIGLSLTKDLVDIYRGDIGVESETGKGSIFTVTLPCSRDLFREDEIVIPTGRKAGLDLSNLPVEESRETIPSGSADHPMILVVEDHADLRNYIKQHLEDKFNIKEAENGLEGLTSATEIIPDLVITDLMMPEMDGLEMCNRIKQDERTSHIPVIMLTAKADRESKMEGLETGADEYLIKPFDAEELQVRVKNLIEQRNKLRQKFSRDFFMGDTHKVLVSADDRFLQKATGIVIDHLAEADFTVEEFSRLVGMSSTHLYRKLQGIAALSPSQFIRNLRLKHSMAMLEKGFDNIARIAYEVGFNDHSYYSKCFRELYGISPSDYITQKKDNPADSRPTS